MNKYQEEKRMKRELESLREALNFRLVWDFLDHMGSNIFVLWVERIILTDISDSTVCSKKNKRKKERKEKNYGNR